jgi:hypothetical protein
LDKLSDNRWDWKPFLYDREEDKLYTGEWGDHGHSAWFYRIEESDPELASKLQSLYFRSEDQVALGYIKKDGEMDVGFGKLPIDVRDDRGYIYPTTPQIESHYKESVSWELFNERDNLKAEDFVEYRAMAYDAVHDKLFLNTDLDCAPYHPNMLYASPELKEISETQPDKIYFGSASEKNGEWSWSWDSLEEEQGDSKYQKRADELFKQRINESTQMAIPGLESHFSFIGLIIVSPSLNTRAWSSVIKHT